MSSTMQDIFFQKSTELKLRVERFLRKGKRVVQSRDQANMNLVLVQSCSSSQTFCQYLIELLQQHRVILHAVWILCSNEKQSPKKNFYNQWFQQNYFFWSISREESLGYQQKHALRNRFSWTLLCSNVISNPGYNRKTLIRKKTFILVRVCFNYEQLFHPMQCTACKKCQCSSTGKRA